MRYVSTYERFLEKKELDLLFERFQFILESEEKLNIEVQSEKEVIEEAPEEEKAKIEDIIAKHFPETKGKLDLDTKEETEKTNEEGGILLAITFASLIPVLMEAAGSLSNFLKRKFGINLDESQMEKIKLMNDAITALEILKKGDENTKVNKNVFLNIEWKRSGWDALCNKLADKLGIEELKAGVEEHKHSDKFAPNLAMNKSDRLVPKKEELAKKKNLEDAKLGKGEKTLFKDEVGYYIGLEIQKIKNKRDELFGTDLGNLIKNGAHKVHNFYTSPIRLALYGMSKFSKPSSKLRDEEFRTKVANVIYAITMVTLAGIGIWGSLGHLAGVSEVTGVVLKGIESGVNTSEIRKQAIGILMGG
jgi:hypothetical protein